MTSDIVYLKECFGETNEECCWLCFSFAFSLSHRLELNDLRNVNRVAMNAITPRPIKGCLNASVTLPNSTVALESASECNLPNPVSSLHSSLRFNVVQFVPQRGRRGVPKPVQGHSGSLNMLSRKLKILLQLVNHSTPTSVDAEVLKGLFEVRDVRLPSGVEDFPSDKREEEK